MKSITLTILIGFCFLVYPKIVLGIIPIEDILLGSNFEDNSLDPLDFIFKKVNKDKIAEVGKLRSLYFKNRQAEDLKNSCDLYQGMNFTSPWLEKQAQRSIASTLQWIGLDLTSKAIGTLASEMRMEKSEFERLKSNLINNYCSKNISVISLKYLEAKIKNFYDNPDLTVLPNIQNSPYVTKYFKDQTQGSDYLKNQMNYLVMNFRSFCSWGNDTEDYRLLSPYLNHPLIMAYVFKHLLNLEEEFDEKQDKIILRPSKRPIQVLCRELICRKTDPKTFTFGFPLSLGATALKTDLEKHYCFHFRFQNLSRNENKKINEWIKNSELEDTIFEIASFVSLLTGLPEPLFNLAKYSDIPFLIKSSIDEKWDLWSKEILSMFSKDLLFEESLRLKSTIYMDENFSGLHALGFKLFLSLGELDQVISENDKLKIDFHLKIPKNYFIQLLLKWAKLKDDFDVVGQNELKKEFAQYLNYQLNQKEKKLRQKFWTKDLGRLMADELLTELLKRSYLLQGNYSSELISIPVKIHYGLFAISYLRHKADINAGRLKLK